MTLTSHLQLVACFRLGKDSAPDEGACRPLTVACHPTKERAPRGRPFGGQGEPSPYEACLVAAQAALPHLLGYELRRGHVGERVSIVTVKFLPVGISGVRVQIFLTRTGRKSRPGLALAAIVIAYSGGNDGRVKWRTRGPRLGAVDR
jgi:hypothetical protein